MRIGWIPALALAGLMTGCATPRLAKPDVPDGRHRRPVNIYGTVLPSIDIARGTAIVAPAAVDRPGAAPLMMFPPDAQPATPGQVPAIVPDRPATSASDPTPQGKR